MTNNLQKLLKGCSLTRMTNRFGGDLWMMRRHIIFKIFLVAVGVIAAFAVALIFFFDSFTVKGDSMEPTFHNGQRIYVNKLLMGARIYRNYDFSSTKLSPLGNEYSSSTHFLPSLLT